MFSMIVRRSTLLCRFPHHDVSVKESSQSHYYSFTFRFPMTFCDTVFYIICKFWNIKFTWSLFFGVYNINAGFTLSIHSGSSWLQLKGESSSREKHIEPLSQHLRVGKIENSTAGGSFRWLVCESHEDPSVDNQRVHFSKLKPTLGKSLMVTIDTVVDIKWTKTVKATMIDILE